MGQVIHFDYPRGTSVGKMRFALDTQTPEDIAVRSVERVSEDFHARYHVIEKPINLKWILANHEVHFDVLCQLFSVSH